MNRTSRDNRDLPHPKPVERVELSEKHIKLRWAVTIALALLGIGLLTYSFMSYLGAEPGLTEIEANLSQGMHLGEQFSFQYRLGQGEKSATAEKKEITALYTELLIKAFRLFEDIENEDSHNIYYINRHPNEAVTVDEMLYKAFEVYAASGDRELYLAPIFEQYNNLFLCDEDWQTYDFDPRQNPELAADFARMAAYAREPEEVRLELLDGTAVRLYVSDAYLRYAQENHIESFIDFGWMKNAFIIDHIADTMIENGYPHGYLAAYDGYLRNWDESSPDNKEQVFNIYDAYGDKGRNVQAAVMTYNAPMNFVQMDSHTVYGGGLKYRLADGTVRTSYLDTADGLCKAAVSEMVSYSPDLGCAELLLGMIPAYIADSLDESRLPAKTFYISDGIIYYNDPELLLDNFYENEEIRYKSSCIF